MSKTRWPEQNYDLLKLKKCIRYQKYIRKDGKVTLFISVKSLQRFQFLYVNILK